MTRPLKKGDQFHVVAASSPITKKEDLLPGIKVLEEWGLICNHLDGIDRAWGYLAGKDEERFNELHSNNHYPLVAFARGGWGSARLLERIQPDIVHVFINGSIIESGGPELAEEIDKNGYERFNNA